jgi:CBS domain-containing protein
MVSEEAVVRDFMSKQLVTAYSDSNVLKAVKLMAKHNIGSVIVQDEEGPIGIFTERDLLSKILGRGKKLEDPILLEVMTRSIDVLNPDATLVDAAKVMMGKKGRLMVFDDSELVGLVTATDIVREIYGFGKTFDFSKSYSRNVFEEGPKTKVELIVHLMDEKRIGSVIISEGRLPHGIFTERDLLKAVLRSGFEMGARVGDYATSPVVTSEEGIDGMQAAAVMAGHHIKRLPLIESGEVVGIVTARDLVEAFASSAW